MSKLKHVSLCYKEATSQPFAYSMIDLSTNVSDVFTYSFGSESTIFPRGKTRSCLEVDDDLTVHFYASAFRESFSGLRPIEIVKELWGPFCETFVGSHCQPFASSCCWNRTKKRAKEQSATKPLLSVKDHRCRTAGSFQFP